MAVIELELTNVFLYQMGRERKYKTIPAMHSTVVGTNLI